MELLGLIWGAFVGGVEPFLRANVLGAIVLGSIVFVFATAAILLQEDRRSRLGLGVLALAHGMWAIGFKLTPLDDLPVFYSAIILSMLNNGLFLVGCYLLWPRRTLYRYAFLGAGLLYVTCLLVTIVWVEQPVISLHFIPEVIASVTTALIYGTTLWRRFDGFQRRRLGIAALVVTIGLAVVQVAPAVALSDEFLRYFKYIGLGFRLLLLPICAALVWVWFFDSRLRMARCWRALTSGVGGSGGGLGLQELGDAIDQVGLDSVVVMGRDLDGNLRSLHRAGPPQATQELVSAFIQIWPAWKSKVPEGPTTFDLEKDGRTRRYRCIPIPGRGVRLPLGAIICDAEDPGLGPPIITDLLKSLGSLYSEPLARSVQIEAIKRWADVAASARHQDDLLESTSAHLSTALDRTGCVDIFVSGEDGWCRWGLPEPASPPAWSRESRAGVYWDEDVGASHWYLSASVHGEPQVVICISAPEDAVTSHAVAELTWLPVIRTGQAFLERAMNRLVLEQAFTDATVRYEELLGESADVASRLRLRQRAHALKNRVQNWFSLVDEISHGARNDDLRRQLEEENLAFLEEVRALLDPGDELARLDLVDVDEALSNVVEPLKIPADRSGVRIEVSSSLQDRAIVRGNRREFEFVLQCLVGNALEAPECKIVQVGVRSEAHDQVTIEVSDDGRGVPKEVADKVFEQGFTTKSAGTGYGLFLSAWIARRRGWEVQLVRNGGRGATFTLSAPCSSAKRRRARGRDSMDHESNSR